MTREEIIDDVFENCRDMIEENDYAAIFEYMFADRQKIQYNAIDLIYEVYADLISKLLDQKSIIDIEYKLPLKLWLMCATKAHITNITVADSGLTISANLKKLFSAADWIKNIEYAFDSVTIINDAEVENPFRQGPFSLLTDQLVVKAQYGDANHHLISCVVSDKNIGVLTISGDVGDSTLIVPEGFTQVVFDKNISALPNACRLSNGVDVKSITLPEKDGLKLPRWIDTVGNNCIIYKKKGQKVECFKYQTEWVKKHLQSI